MPDISPSAVIPVVLNAASGTVKDLEPEILRQLLLETAAAEGIRVDVHLVQPIEVEVQLKKLLAKGEPEIWVGGGDGSVLTAATVLMNTTTTLGVLPFGTFNLLARDLGIPLDPAEAVRALISAPAEAIDVAEVNGQPFLCAAQFGFFPAQVALEEEFHGRQWWRKIIIGVWNLSGAYFKYPELELLLEQPDSGPRKLKTRSLTVSNNVYAESLGLVPGRDSLKDGSMGIYVSRHRSCMGLLKGLVWTMLGHLYSDKSMLFFELQEFVLKTRKSRRIPTTLDGEMVDVRTPLHFKVHSQGLRVRKVKVVVDTPA